MSTSWEIPPFNEVLPIQLIAIVDSIPVFVLKYITFKDGPVRLRR